MLHPFAEVTLDHCVVGPIVAVEGAEVDGERLGHRRVGRGRDRVLRPRAGGGGGLLTVSTAADRKTGDGLDAGRPPDARGLHRPRQGARRAPRRLELAAARAPHRRRRPVAGAGLGRAPPGRLHPLLVRPAGLAHAAPLPLRRRRPGAPPVPHVAALRRPGLHAAAPLDARGDPHRRERRERDGRHARAATSRSARRTCGIRLDEYLRYGLEAGFFYAT